MAATHSTADPPVDLEEHGVLAFGRQHIQHLGEIAQLLSIDADEAVTRADAGHVRWTSATTRSTRYPAAGRSQTMPGKTARSPLWEPSPGQWEVPR